ncbi:MAG: CHASE2 domain-containing protein [Rhizobiales bacterium]|nr:CHASE2 domain-containing protein [Hyphomicrobiales bacterium]
MRKVVRHIIGEGETARHRIETAIITVATALAMLTGVGQYVVDSHGNFGDADHLAALSLVMSGVPNNATPVTFIDVDDKTRVAWKATGVTPHGALAALVKQAADNGAKSILFDFDLTPSSTDQKADPGLAALLRDYPANAPDLLLARNIRFVRSTAAGGEKEVQAASAAPTPYDLDAAGKPNIRWVTTLNDIGKDRAVRRIKLWQTVCDGASGTAYPSAALVMAALPEKGQNHQADLAAFLKSRVDVECGHKPITAPPWPPVRDAVAQLPYVFADTRETPALFRIEVNGRDTVALRRISAGLLVKYENDVAQAAGDIDRDPFEGRAVIVGASYTDSGDIYETPFGTMPGALVLANSVVQARAIVETAPVSPLTENVLAMVLFLLLAYIARAFVGAASILLLGIVTLAALFLISRWLGFASGIDVIAVAVPGFALFKLVDSAIFIATSVPKHGWRAILRP